VYFMLINFSQKKLENWERKKKMYTDVYGNSDGLKNGKFTEL